MRRHRAPSLPRPLLLAIGGVLLAGAEARAQSCTTVRVSTDSLGAQNSAPSKTPAVSGDGRFVAFTSPDGTLVPGDTNGISDVFVKDLLTGTVRRASVSSSGAQCTLAFPSSGIPPSYPSISADGQRVAFCTEASDLVAGDTNNACDVFVHDLVSGQTTLVSANPAGTSADGASGGAYYIWASGIFELGLSISGDGQSVAFASDASDLVPGDINQWWDIFVRDLTTGVTERVSVDTSGAESHGGVFLPALNGDGRYVAFVGTAPDLVAGDTNQRADIFVRDRVAQITTRVSNSTAGMQGNDDSGIDFPNSGCGFNTCPRPLQLGLAISGDARFVAFGSAATNLVSPPGPYHVYVHDRSSGETAIVSRTPGVSVNQEGGMFPSLSHDGRFVAFSSGWQQRDPLDVDIQPDAFRFDRLTQVLECMSVRSDGSRATSFLTLYEWPRLAMSSDGTTVAFETHAIDLVPGDTNAVVDVCARTCDPSPGTAYCHATTAGCPCANVAEPFGGCAHVQGSGGALDASGTASVSSDTVRLTAQHLLPSTFALFAQGMLTSAPDVPFGDGLACLAGTMRRLGTRPASGGSVAFGHGIALDPSISVAGGLPPAGGVRHYQVFYRDISSFCTTAALNTTNGVTIVWGP